MAKRALILVDIQNDYFPGGKWTLHKMDAAADNAAKLLAHARKVGDLVIHVRHESTEADAPFFVTGSDGAKINAKVAQQGNEVIVLKHQVNSFRDTNLKQILDENGITDVTITGAMSHMCVDGITRAASDFGYKATVIHDACASRELEFNGTKVPAELAHAAFMSALGFAYANLQSTAEYLAA